MTPNLDRAGRWPAVTADAENVVRVDFIRGRRLRPLSDLPPLRYPNVDGMPERQESIAPLALLSAAVCAGVLWCSVILVWL